MKGSAILSLLLLLGLANASEAQQYCPSGVCPQSGSGRSARFDLGLEFRGRPAVGEYREFAPGTYSGGLLSDRVIHLERRVFRIERLLECDDPRGYVGGQFNYSNYPRRYR
jgi:hypothetical protein